MNSELPVGSFVQLSYENLTDVLQGIQQGYDKLRGIDTESVMLVACVSRYMLLDDLNWQLIWGYGGRVPITGMFGWGEFSKIDGTNMFSSEMLDIISFSEHTEKPFSYDFIKDEISLDKRKYDMVLHHLIMYSAREMQDINDRLELSIEDKTSQLRENYYRDLVSGFPNKNRLLRDIALKKVDKVAYIVLPLLQRYASYYGLELIRRLERAFGSFTKFCFEKENGYFYQISSESYAIGCSNRISFHDFVSKLQWYLELLKKHIFSIGGADIYLDATLGIADSNSDNICENANTALVIAINEHRQYVIYDPDSVSVTKMKANMEMVSKIRSAIEEDRIFPVFQPIYDNSKHTITKYEALARMEDTDGSIIPPLSFIEVAKLSGQYSAITTVMMKKAFEFFKESKYEFSLNLSISDIKNAESNAAILSRLSSFPKPQHVVFEILETEKIEEFEEVQQFISRVKQLGGHIALDDFGNGYSNMMYLTRLDIDYIKLDGSIVKDAATDKVAENAVKTMLNFVKITGQKVIAEYVSDQAIQQKIQELGVDYSQGYYIGRPAKMLLPDDFSLA
jgi:EAL domain-containing protein (putative c-di-GMP-specific phosphodiesterase class I)